MHLYILFKKVLEYLGRILIISQVMCFVPNAHILERTVQHNESNFVLNWTFYLMYNQL